MMTNLGTLGGTGHSFAYAINNSSQVVGGASTYDGFYHAFLWQDGIMTDLGTLGGSYSYATGINNLGQIVGYSQTSNGFFHAFLWQDGAMMDLGTIGEPTYPGSSYANDINDAGKVVGYSSTSTGVTHAFLWQNGIMTDLGSLGGNFSYASAINNVGQVVGYSSLPSGYSHAVLWKEEPLMITATAGVGGIISPSGDVIVNYGSNQTFTITPDKYYRILDVIVDGESVGSIKRYTFYDVTKDHAITATFVSTNIAVERPCELPDFGSASFTTPLIINNPYFPLVPGTTFLYEPRPNEDNVVNTIVVTDGIKNILGINCVVVHDYETVNGVLTEDTLDWYAQDDKGNIWYFGEDTKTYLCCDHGDPNCVDTTGSWEAGKDSALPGYLMLAKPRPGVCYQQESAEDAQDRAKVLRLNAKVSIDYGDFEDCLKTKEWIPLAPGEIEHKYYAPGVGLVLIKELKGKTVRVELIDKY
jgi:probable HAF family extracellular repeat protein